MRHLLASTCLLTIGALIPIASAHAETVIDAKRTDPVRTSTVKSGASDDVRISSTGSIVPTSGFGVLLDSTNKVTNEGLLQITNSDVAFGIRAMGGTSGSIVNAAGGKIILDETYEATDADKDGDLDGPFATGVNRFGISTANAFTGDIVNNGTITIEGRDSAGISLDGPLTGKVTTDGTITVTGDRAIGVKLGDVTGPVRIAGGVAVQGEGATAVSLTGNLGGALVVQGTLAATGYRTTTVPSDVSKLDADDLLQGGPALSVAGNVAGGIILAVPPKDNSPTDNDEDKDGIDDSKEGSASVSSSGAAAAVRIGAANRDVAIGAVAGNGSGHGLVIDGAVAGNGTYAGVDGNGIVIGGLGGAVTIAGGMSVNGTVGAASNGASATAIRIGSGATVGEIKVAGAVTASGGNAATAKTTAILIDTGAQTFTISNSGSIKATAAGTSGFATAILDRSGEVDLVNNSGAISASGGAAGNNIAIDLSANTTGARIGQTVVASGVTAPSIAGDIRFGSGNDVFDLADGSMAGNTIFGAGANQLSLSGDATYAGKAQFGSGADTMSLSGTSVYAGDVDFGGGTDKLTLTGTAKFAGGLSNAQGLAVAVTGGTLDIGKGSASIQSLSVGAGGTIGVTIDTVAKTTTLYQVAGAADFAAGSKVAVKLTSVASAEGQYVFLKAGSVTGGTQLAANSAIVPFLFKSNVVATNPNELAIDIKRKTSTELGLNRSLGGAYDAVYAALGKDAKVAGVFLDIVDGDRFRGQLRQMLPDHAGGTFEAVQMGSRATAGFLADPNAPFKDEGRWGYWIQQVGWGRSKGIDDSAGYAVSGWGLSAGGEIKTENAGNFGVSVGYLYGKDSDRGTDNSVNSDQYEAAVYWRGRWGSLASWARGSYGHVDFKSGRHFAGTVGTENVTRDAKANWNGRLVSASGGASYTLAMGSFSIRPIAAVDYYRLKEDGYSETGGGDAFNLIVGDRTSDELAVSGTVAAGFDFGGWDQESGWLRVEVEGGRRQLVGGSLGTTEAHFTGGQSFRLTPDDRTSGWVGKFRAVGGNSSFKIAGEAGAEQQQGRAALSLRASLMMGF